jgi:hypothetical protein
MIQTACLSVKAMIQAGKWSRGNRRIQQLRWRRCLHPHDREWQHSNTPLSILNNTTKHFYSACISQLMYTDSQEHTSTAAVQQLLQRVDCTRLHDWYLLLTTTATAHTSIGYKGLSRNAPASWHIL